MNSLQAETISLVDVERELGKRRLSEFVKMSWHVIESSPYVHNWHIDVICEHLEEVAKRVIQGSPHGISRLIVNIPPRHSKSLIVAVFWMVWIWIVYPQARFLFASYAQKLSTRDSVKCRRLIQSKWFQDRWGDLFRLMVDQNEKTRFENTLGGIRIATSVRGTGTGEGGDIIAIDDPHNMEEVHSDTIRQGVIDWWKEAMSMRVNDENRGARVLIMQRGHELDLTGHLLSEESGKWEHLCLPGRYEPKRSCVTILGEVDPRTEEGELICSQRYDEEAMESLKLSLGSYGFAGQIQQRPSPDDGGMIKRGWFRYWDRLPDQMTAMIVSVDMNVKDGEKNDYMAAGVWGRSGPSFYLIDQIRVRKEFSESIKILEEFLAKHPKARGKYIEDKANGPAVMSVLKRRIFGLLKVPEKIVRSGKLSRVAAVSPVIESGNVYLPNPTLNPWVNDFVEECAVFPNGAHDDQVDQMTAAILILEKQGLSVIVHGSLH